MGNTGPDARARPPPVVAPSTPPAQKAPAAIAPLPTGTKIAFVNLQVVFSESELGKQGQAPWRVLNEKLFANLNARVLKVRSARSSMSGPKGP
jgi:Skp family chaperone for outer membrane proteins